MLRDFLEIQESVRIGNEVSFTSQSCTEYKFPAGKSLPVKQSVMTTLFLLVIDIMDYEIVVPFSSVSL
ncbi:hypothetical protein FGO68_gene2964 [Halteria grandinella]|uniref:Uncharacterized protein n=1 Tax=Halteria grandinella TaxID=5974 RepID=A0A8J8T5V9_HALGN|nr:hypothetical protein FGO68_gene2964 [Halteria grandinella]